MAEDVNPALRAELEAALASLEPQIRGLEDLTRHVASPELVLAATEALTALTTRKNLIDNVIVELDAVNNAMGLLEADGYPSDLQTSVTDPVYEELALELEDMQAAVEVFTLMASVMNVDLGTPASIAEAEDDAESDTETRSRTRARLKADRDR